MSRRNAALSGKSWPARKTLSAAAAQSVILLFGFAAAAYGGDMSVPICTIYGKGVTEVAPGVATLAVILLGIQAMMGKISWNMALIVGAGITVAFTVPNFVGMLGGTACS